jgi:hypothetical protein
MYYHVHWILVSVPILGQMNPICTFHIYFHRSILILSSHLRLDLPNYLFPSGFPTTIYIEHRLNAYCMLCTSYPVECVILIIRGEESNYGSYTHFFGFPLLYALRPKYSLKHSF